MGAVHVAESAARRAAEVIRDARGSGLKVRHKGAIDLVTQVDLAAEAEIRAHLESETPGIPILAEEGGGAWDARTRWIVDPLDGTTNFVHGLSPFFPSTFPPILRAGSDGTETTGILIFQGFSTFAHFRKTTDPSHDHS